MHYRLRTLLIVLALGPPVLAGAGGRMDRFRPRSLDEKFRDILREMDALGEVDFPEEPLIGYPFGPCDPRYPNGFPPNGRRPSQRSRISNE